MSKKITNKLENFSKWYNNIIINADLAENSGVRGCMVIKPYGFAIWEEMKKVLDKNNNMIVLAWNFYQDIKNNNKELSNNFVSIKDLEK